MMELQKLTVPTYFEPNVLNTFSVRDAGLKTQAYKECMRPWSNAVLHMSRTQFNTHVSRTQFNTHVKFGVD